MIKQGEFSLRSFLTKSHLSRTLGSPKNKYYEKADNSYFMRKSKATA